MAGFIVGPKECFGNGEKEDAVAGMWSTWSEWFDFSNEAVFVGTLKRERFDSCLRVLLVLIIYDFFLN